MSDQAICPDRELFVGFLTGGLEDDLVEKIEAHLADCDACGDTVRSLNINDTFSDLVQAAHGKSLESPHHPSELGGLLLRLEALADPQTKQNEIASNDANDDLKSRVQEVELLLEPAQNESENGRLSHYRILRLLGAGGMGVVYHAEDTQLKRLVALKILRPSLGISARNRFVQEAQVAAAIDHDNVVTIYHVGGEGQLAFLAMQWLEGETLEDRLKRNGTLEPDEAIHIASQVALGLAAAHRKKLIHRDIKPANIWLEADRNRAKILDFGLAQIIDDDPQLTETGMIAGTPAYMSPEQAQGRSVDERSDLFSLGTMLYRMLTGKLPFDSANALATIRSIQLDNPAEPRQCDLAIPSTLSDTVMDLLEKEPRDRPESAALVAKCLVEKTRPAHPSGARKAPPSSADRGRGAWWGAGIAAMLLLGLGGYFAAPTVYRIVTDSAVITVKSEDPNVKVEVLEGAEVIRVIDTTTDDSVTLKSGNYDLRIKGENSNLSIEPNKITLRRNNVERATVVRRPIKPKPSKIADSKNINSPESNPLRRFSAASKPNDKPSIANAQPSQDGKRRLYLKFQDTPWSEVLPWIAKESGLSFSLDYTPTGNFTLVSEKAYTAKEALDVIQGKLLASGYVLVASRGSLYIVDLEEEFDRKFVSDLLTDTPVSEIESLGRFEIAKVTFDIRAADTAAAVKELTLLTGSYGYVVPVPRAKRIIVTDTGARIREIQSALERMEDLASTTAKKEITEFQILDEIEKDPRYFALLTKIDEHSDRPPAPDPESAERADEEYVRLKERQDELFQKLRPRIVARLKSQAGNAVTIEPDVALPKPRVESQEVRVLRLKYENAEEMEPKLEELLSDTGLQVVSNAGSNSLVLKGNQKVIDHAMRLVADLDVPPPAVPLQSTYKGKTFSEWMNVLKTEQSRDGLTDAVFAASNLATPKNASVVCDALVPILRKRGSKLTEQYGPVTSRIASDLKKLDQPAIANFVVDEMKDGNSQSRAFLRKFLKLQGTPNRQGMATESQRKFWLAMEPQANELTDFLVGSTAQESTKEWAVVSLAYLWRSMSNETAAENEKVLPLLKNRLDAKAASGEIAFATAEAIAVLQPDSDILADVWLPSVLKKRLDQDDAFHVSTVAAKMRHRAEIAVPFLAKTTRDLARIQVAQLAPGEEGTLVIHPRSKTNKFVVDLGEIAVGLDRQSESAQTIVSLLQEFASEDLVDISGSGIKKAAAEALAKIEARAEEANNE